MRIQAPSGESGEKGAIQMGRLIEKCVADQMSSLLPLHFTFPSFSLSFSFFLRAVSGQQKKMVVISYHKATLCMPKLRDAAILLK